MTPSALKSIIEFMGKKLKLGEDYISLLTDKIQSDQIGDDIEVKTWIRRQGSIYKGIFYLPIILCMSILSLSFLGSSLDIINLTFSNVNVKLVIYTVQVIFILFILIYLSFPKTSGGDIANLNNDVLNRALNSMQTFFKYWYILWASWLGLYAILCTKGYLDLYYTGLGDINENGSITDAFWFSSLIDAFNNCSSLIFFCLYFELVKRTQEKNSIQKSNPLFASIIATVIFFLFEVLILSKFPVYRFHFEIASGLIAGIAMGLFFSRLGSVLLHLPIPIVAYFILYAVSQTGYIFFENGKYPELSIMFIMIAFLGKTILFIIVHYLHDTKRLMYYMFRMYFLLIGEIDSKYRQIFLSVLKELNSSPKTQNNETIL